MNQQKNMKAQRWKLILQFSQGRRVTFALAVVFSLLNTVFFSVVPQIVRVTVDSVIGTEEFDVPAVVLQYLETAGGRDFFRVNLYLCGLFVVLTSTISAIFQYLSRKNLSMASEGFIKALRDELFVHLSKLPLSWHMHHHTGDIIQRATSDVETVKKFTSIQLYEILKVMFLLCFTMFLMFSMNVSLAFLALAFFPVSVLFSYFFFGAISKKFFETDEKEGILSSVVQENLTGVRVVRAFGREAYELQRFDKANNDFAEAWIRMGRTNGYFWGGEDFITSLQILAVVLGTTIFAVEGKITTGEFIAFVSYNASLLWPIRTLGRMLVDMSKAFVSMDRISYILEAQEEKDQDSATTADLTGDIVFQKVSFAYETDKPVLQDLNFTIKAGTTFGILGKTGSGKSTLIHLLNRLYELEGDSDILIGGTSIKQVKLSHLRRNIGIVFGEPFLYSKSIGENIGISQENPSQSELEQVAKIASIHESILGFQEGYDTVIGERGVTLSGGQKQRIAIARGLLQKTPIVVFDDSLSAVDTETDVKIRRALRENLGNATVILVSHRITTLMEAEQILVLEEGKISALGNHQELIARAGIYQDIYRIQMTEEGK